MNEKRRATTHYWLATLALSCAACAGTPPSKGPAPSVAPGAHASRMETPIAPDSVESVEAEEVVLDGGICADTSQTEALRGDEDGAGYLDPKVVRNVVQGGYFSMRECYEEGLARDTRLTGKIQVRFVIDRDGRVSSAHLDDNTLPDCEAARCMLEVYRSLEFPQPDGGRVTVVYPLTFTPS